MHLDAIVTSSIILSQLLTAICVLRAIVLCANIKRYGDGLLVYRWMLYAQPFYLYTCVACKEYGMIGLSVVIIVMCREGFSNK